MVLKSFFLACLLPPALQPCPNDALNPLSNELVYTFEGLPSVSLKNLRPMLDPAIKNTSDYNVSAESHTFSYKSGRATITFITPFYLFLNKQGQKLYSPSYIMSICVFVL